MNKLTGVCASDCAEAIAWFTRNFKVNSTSPMKLENILLAPVKEGVAYDVIFNLSTGLTSIPVRSVINPNPNPT